MSGPRFVLVDRLIVRAVGTVALLGGMAFFIAHLPTIGYYLGGAGIIFWTFTWGWSARYQRVLAHPPDPKDGWEPTGETYLNPGGGGPVAVWHRGIQRLYVLIADQNSPDH